VHGERVRRIDRPGRLIDNAALNAKVREQSGQSQPDRTSADDENIRIHAQHLRPIHAARSCLDV
jgi:hypothetical protein